MIASLGFVKEFKNVIAYNERKVSEGTAELISNTTFESSLEDKVKSFQEIIDLMPKRMKNNCLHVPISLPSHEKLTNEKFIEIGKEYLEKMGYGNTLHLIYLHTDTDKSHIHIVCPTVDLDGKKIPEFKNHFKSMKIIRSIEVREGLTEVKEMAVEKNKLNHLNLEKYSLYYSVKKLSPLEIDTIFNSLELKESLKTILESEKPNATLKGILNKTKPNNFETIIRILNNNGLYLKSKKTQLIDDLDYILSISKNKDEFVDKIVKQGFYVRQFPYKSEIQYGLRDKSFYCSSSKLPERFRFKDSFRKSIQVQQPEGAKRNIKDVQRFVFSTVNKSLLKAKSTEELSSLLLKNNISVIYDKNSSGIYGISFSVRTPENDTFQFKGSELDSNRSLSWNKVKETLEQNRAEAPEKKEMISIVSATKTLESEPSPVIGRKLKRALDDNSEDEPKKKRKDLGNGM